MENPIATFTGLGRRTARDLPVTDVYNVYAWWPADPSHHAQATYHGSHAGGISRVIVNQQLNGGQWNLLGTYAMAPGQNHRVVLASQFGGKVVADAIKFEATGSGTPRTGQLGAAGQCH